MAGGVRKMNINVNNLSHLSKNSFKLDTTLKIVDNPTDDIAPHERKIAQLRYDLTLPAKSGFGASKNQDKIKLKK